MKPAASSWSRTWWVLAATARAKPVPPPAIETWPLEPVSTRPAVHQLAPGVGGEVAGPASRREQPVEGDRDASDQLVVGSAAVGGADLAGVEVLEDDPAAGRERVDHPIEHLQAGRHVLQHEALVDEVPRAGRQRIRHQVEAAHVELGELVGLEPRHVEVGGHDATGRPDLRGHPDGDRTAAGTQLEAAPAGPDPDAAEVLRGERVERLLQRVEADDRLRSGVREEVLRFTHRAHATSAPTARRREWPVPALSVRFTSHPRFADPAPARKRSDMKLRSHRRGRRAGTTILAVCAIGALVAACGDDDDSAGGASTATPADATAAPTTRPPRRLRAPATAGRPRPTAATGTRVGSRSASRTCSARPSSSRSRSASSPSGTRRATTSSRSASPRSPSATGTASSPAGCGRGRRSHRPPTTRSRCCSRTR